VHATLPMWMCGSHAKGYERRPLVILRAAALLPIFRFSDGTRALPKVENERIEKASVNTLKILNTLLTTTTLSLHRNTTP